MQTRHHIHDHAAQFARTSPSPSLPFSGEGDAKRSVCYILGFHFNSYLCNMSDRIEIPESRWATWLLFVMCVALMAACVYGFRERLWLVAVSVALVGWLAYWFFKRAMDARARVILSEIGIEDRNNGFGVIEWRDITSARKGRVDETEFISIAVRNEAEYLARLTPMKRRTSQLGVKMGYSPIMIAMFNLKITSDELHEMIEQRIMSPLKR